MKFDRENISTFMPFELGVHKAKIKAVTNKPAQSGRDMFEMEIEGLNGESGRYYLTFETDYTEQNLNRILASIEDNNQIIPPEADWGHNDPTAQFLTGKSVFIRASDGGEYNGRKQIRINFLTGKEYEKEMNAQPQEPDFGRDGEAVPDDFDPDKYPF